MRDAEEARAGERWGGRRAWPGEQKKHQHVRPKSEMRTTVHAAPIGRERPPRARRGRYGRETGRSVLRCPRYFLHQTRIRIYGRLHGSAAGFALLKKNDVCDRKNKCTTERSRQTIPEQRGESLDLSGAQTRAYGSAARTSGNTNYANTQAVLRRLP